MRTVTESGAPSSQRPSGRAGSQMGRTAPAAPYPLVWVGVGRGAEKGSSPGALRA